MYSSSERKGKGAYILTLDVTVASSVGCRLSTGRLVVGNEHQIDGYPLENNSRHRPPFLHQRETSGPANPIQVSGMNYSNPRRNLSQSRLWRVIFFEAWRIYYATKKNLIKTITYLGDVSAFLLLFFWTRVTHRQEIYLTKWIPWKMRRRLECGVLRPSWKRHQARTERLSDTIPTLMNVDQFSEW